RRGARQHGFVHAFRDRHLAHVHLEDLFTAADVRQAHHDLAVEAAGTQQRRIEHVRTVGRGDHDHTVVALEAVHLDQQLVERLFAFVMTAANTGAAVATHGIDLVDEDDAGSLFLGGFEHVAHTRGANTDEHLDEVGTGDREEGNLGFARDRLGEQGLAGTGLTYHQHAARNTAAQALVFVGVTQEVDKFLHVFLG